ncbi:MAG: preprotein translocase subunit SecG [Opitutaceae bacterium]
MSIVLGIATFFLILVALFLILVVLAQKAKSDGGMGAAMGGGVAEAAFGAETSNVLSKSTIYAAVIFFVLTFALYLGRIYERKQAARAAGSALPEISAPAGQTPAPGAATPLTMPMVPPSATPAVTTPATTPAATAPETPAKQP